MNDSVIIVSGGMDSVTLLHWLIKQSKVTPAVITFLYGQKHVKEAQCAKFQAALLNCESHQLIDLSPLKVVFQTSALVSPQIEIPDFTIVRNDPQPSTYVPNRNMIFLALAAACAETLGVTDVYYGAQRHGMYGYWDTTPEFLAQLNTVYNLNRKSPVQIKAPLVNYSKADILRLGLELGVDYSQTWSCYAGQEMACGRCPTCVERLKAFEVLGIPDPLQYSI